QYAGERLPDGDRRATAPVYPASVGGTAHLRRHLVEGQVERPHLVLGTRLGTYHRTLREGGQLHMGRSLVLSRIGFAVDLDVHPHYPMVMLLQPGQLLCRVGAEPV